MILMLKKFSPNYLYNCEGFIYAHYNNKAAAAAMIAEPKTPLLPNLWATFVLTLIE